MNVLNIIAIVVIALLATVACVWLGEFVRAKKFVGKSNRFAVATRMTIARCLDAVARILAPLQALRHLARYGGGTMQFVNTLALGTHDASITKFADAAITVRHLLYKKGTDVDHIAVCGATDMPLGTVADEVATADIATIPMALLLLGKGPTKRMVAADTITAGNPVFAAASGKVSASGTILVGTAMEDAVADDPFEVQDDMPVRLGNATGAGGAVTQITTAATGVTLSKPCGQITTVALTTAAAAEERFTVTNTLVAATDVIVLSTTYAGAGTPMLSVVAVTAGTFDVVITNVHAANALNAVMVINFAVIKAVAA